jgi:hypothetical protein
MLFLVTDVRSANLILSSYSLCCTWAPYQRLLKNYLTCFPGTIHRELKLTTNLSLSRIPEVNLQFPILLRDGLIGEAHGQLYLYFVLWN